MSEPLSLGTYLIIARAVGTTVPFDPDSAFLLLSQLDGVIDLRLPRVLDDALQAELDGIEGEEPYRAAIARSALCRLIGDIERRLAAEPARVAG